MRTLSHQPKTFERFMAKGPERALRAPLVPSDNFTVATEAAAGTGTAPEGVPAP